MPSDSGYAFSVVAHRSYRSSHMCTVAEFGSGTEGLVVAIKKVPAVYVVDKTVAIIVNAFAGNLSRVHPCISSQVFMLKVNSCVQHHAHDVVAACRDVPRRRPSDAWPVRGARGPVTRVRRPPHF